MFWADRIAEEVVKRYGGDIKGGSPLVIRDEKTVSGRVHVGSMRGVAIHGAISEALLEKKIPHTYLYEFNDFDVMDSVPPFLEDEKFKPYLGALLRDVPSPDASAKNFAEYFANDFKEAIDYAGFYPTYYWGSELYLSGKMDGVIREALLGAGTIRAIYKEVSGSQKEDAWLPISVICPQCKKIATTQASDFDGETVQVHCKKHAVKYTEGCGFEGRVNPFGGNAKLPWKVEWAAKWKVQGVMVEGGGKDHSTKGGSRDVANHIAKEVFKYEPPFDIPYEFLLVGGKKMSSSKGKGSSAKEVGDLLPPKIFRLTLLSKDINQQFNFDPEGDTIPTLYDLYDKLAEGYKAGVMDDYARLFVMSHAPGERGRLEVPFLPRFSQVAFLVQMPHLILDEEVRKMKGEGLNDSDRRELHERATYAQKWLASYAPEKFVFKLQKSLPEAARSLTDLQRQALQVLLKDLEMEYPKGGDAMHALLRAIPVRPHIAIPPRDFFTALYSIFLGKDSGPQAGWFLSALPKDFVLQRLKEASL